MAIDIETAEDPEMKEKLIEVRGLVLRALEAQDFYLLKLKQYIDALQKLFDLYERNFEPAA